MSVRRINVPLRVGDYVQVVKHGQEGTLKYGQVGTVNHKYSSNTTHLTAKFSDGRAYYLARTALRKLDPQIAADAVIIAAWKLVNE